MLNNENSYLFKFAWKSIRRNAGRSFFIGFSVSLAVFIAVWVVAFFHGLNYQIEKAVVNTNTGYFQIQEPAYAKSTDSAFPRVFDEEMQKLMTPPIKSYSPELLIDGNISTPDGAAGLVVIGIEPSLHEKFLPIKRRIKSGEFLNETDEDSVIIGKELAELFRFSVGDQLILNYQDQKGELRSEILQIKGIYHYNSKGYEKRFVYINQASWKKLFLTSPMEGILFNRIAIKTEDLTAATALQSRLSGSDLVLKSWKNLNPEMAVVLDFHDGMINFFFLIIGITITMTILTPVQMLWQERLKELRMLNILGVSNSKFWKIGLFEVFQMIVSSSLLSSFILIVIIGIQAQTGVDFRFLNDGVSIERAGIKLPGIIYPHLTIQQILMTFAFVIVVLSISYLWSIHRTLKKLEEAP
jgi:ABC-type lipoprotein release transport system permease subunit